MRDALIASLALGAVMTLGDVAWAVFHIQHRVAYGVVHGAVMCCCLGLAVGVRPRQPIVAALAGLVIGVLAAATFYALAPVLGLGAMFPAWMLLWILFAVLQQRFQRTETLRMALLRGTSAAVLSGVAFYLISGIWTERGDLSLARHFASWSFAFLPGFLSLFFLRAPSNTRSGSEQLRI
jgi:hypothetical protein